MVAAWAGVTTSEDGWMCRFIVGSIPMVSDTNAAIWAVRKSNARPSGTGPNEQDTTTLLYGIVFMFG